MFCKNRPYGGARGGLCEKAGLEVVICHPRSVCAKFSIDKGNGCGDIAGRKVWRDGLTDGLTDSRWSYSNCNLQSYEDGVYHN